MKRFSPCVDSLYSVVVVVDMHTLTRAHTHTHTHILADTHTHTRRRTCTTNMYKRFAYIRTHTCTDDKSYA